VACGELLRALLLQVLYTVRSERLLIEQLEYNVLFRRCGIYALPAACVGPPLTR